MRVWARLLGVERAIVEDAVLEEASGSLVVSGARSRADQGVPRGRRAAGPLPRPPRRRGRGPLGPPRGRPTRLCELLAGRAYEEAGLDLARPDKLTAVYGYVAANRRAIENYAIVPLASSGPMEKGVDLVVARRFKARGMSWFRRGASPLLHLRLLRLNGTWGRYWVERFAALLRPWPSAA